jgi:uncharacterized membrane protein YfcA
MPLAIWINLAIFLATFTQGFTGFGSAMIAMALLPDLVGIQVATPLVALVVEVFEIYMLVRYRQSMNVKTIWPIIASAIVGIPFGLLFLKRMDENLILALLGTLIVAYALYGLSGYKLPELKRRRWRVGAGFLAGMLGGAYNVSGPPVILYGTARRWPPLEFKANLQGFFVFSSFFTLMGHLISRNVTPAVWHNFWISLPALVIGGLLGTSLDRFLDPERFRKIVLVVLVILGVRLIL